MTHNNKRIRIIAAKGRGKREEGIRNKK